MDQTDPNGVQAVPQTSDEVPASELSATPDEQQPSFDPAEIQALRERAERADQLEREAAAVRQRNAQYEQQLAQQAAAAWQQEEQRVRGLAAQQDDPQAAVAMMEEHFRRKEAALVGINQQTQQQMRDMQLNAWVHENVREHGLTQEDGQYLFSVAQRNPDAVPIEAKRIKESRSTQNTEIETLKKQVEQLTRAQQAGQIVQSGAWQTGGTNPRPVNPDIVPGSLDDFKQALAGTAGFR